MVINYNPPVGTSAEAMMCAKFARYVLHMMCAMYVQRISSSSYTHVVFNFSGSPTEGRDISDLENFFKREFRNIDKCHNFQHAVQLADL